MVPDRKLIDFLDGHAGVFISFQTLGCLVLHDLGWLGTLPVWTVRRCLGSDNSRGITA